MGSDQTSSPTSEPRPSIRCAIYTRKSTDEGLTQEFNTLEAQRDAAEAYVRSQVHAGWKAIDDRYDDGGYTGANLDRPRLRKLLDDIRAGEIDCVLVYKVDRLSRSLLDFARLMEIFERHKVSLVSITQPINTTNSLGRLTMNILLSFADFERCLISDRTKDKRLAALKRGRWVGGVPILGYDISAGGGKLEVNAEEASRVQSIFALYLQHRSLSATLQEMRERRWMTKHWITRAGKEHREQHFTKGRLYRLLRNVVYLGKVSHQGELYAGEHQAIVETEVWERAKQSLLEEQKSTQSLRLDRKAVAARRTPPAVKVNPVERVARITRLLALALKYEDLIQSGIVSNYAALAALGQVSKARITQMISLLNLAPDIQEEILFIQAEDAEQSQISESAVRKITSTLLWNQQREQWRKMRRTARNSGLSVDQSL